MTHLLVCKILCSAYTGAVLIKCLYYNLNIGETSKGSLLDLLFDVTVMYRLNQGHHRSSLCSHVSFSPLFFCLCVCVGLHCPLQDPLDVARSVIVIRSLVPGGVADNHGGLLPGDQLVFVNDTQLDTCSLAQAVEVLKSAPPGRVYLGIRKQLVVRANM